MAFDQSSVDGHDPSLPHTDQVGRTREEVEDNKAPRAPLGSIS